MKKLITLLLVLTGAVCTASADEITVYFEPGSNWSESNAKFVMHLQKYGDGDSERWIHFSETETGSGIYSATYEYKSTDDRCWIFRQGPGMTDGWTQDTNYWNLSGQLTVPSVTCYITKDNSAWNGWTSTATPYLPWNYYFMSNATGSWKAVDEMTEDEGVYSYTFAAATYADKQFAIAKGDAFESDGDFDAGNDYDGWKKVIRPVAEGTTYNIGFWNYNGDTETDTKDAGAALWYVEAANNGGNITLDFTPSNSKFAVTCEHSVEITSLGYATYSNAYNYTVKDATAYTINEAETTATLNSLGTDAKVPAGTGIIISGSAGIYKVVPSDGSADVSGNMLVGSGSYQYQITLWDGSKTYQAFIFADGVNGIGFYKAAYNSDLKPHKAFLRVYPNTAREFIGFDFEATGIDEVKNNEMKNDAIYNLQGVRLNKFQKGLNIVNGKKVMVK